MLHSNNKVLSAFNVFKHLISASGGSGTDGLITSSVIGNTIA